MSVQIRRPLYGKLAGDTTLNALLAPAAAGYTKAIYYEVAPDAAALPYVIFTKSSGVPTEAMSDPSAYETDVWLIKAVDRDASADDADTIAARIRTLLYDTPTMTISNGSLLYLRRQSDVNYTEVQDGVMYRHSGAFYRLVWDRTD